MCRSTAGKAVGAVDVPESVIDVLTSLRDYLQDKCEPPIYVSDRRFMKALNLLQVAAYADGRQEVGVLCHHPFFVHSDVSCVVHFWRCRSRDKSTELALIQASQEVKSALLHQSWADFFSDSDSQGSFKLAFAESGIVIFSIADCCLTWAEYSVHFNSCQLQSCPIHCMSVIHVVCPCHHDLCSIVVGTPLHLG